MAFDAGDSTDNVGIASYEWNFGDGTSGTGITTTHEFANAGTYTVKLTVEDAAGNQATDTIPSQYSQQKVSQHGSWRQLASQQWA